MSNLLQFSEVANEVSKGPNREYGMGLLFLRATVSLLISCTVNSKVEF